MKNIVLTICLHFICAIVKAQLPVCGICVMEGDSIRGENMSEQYSMYSLMKFPQALFVAEELKRRKIPLTKKILVKKRELMQETWSPMLGVMGEEQWFSYGELLAFSLQESDNNACDILFRLFGKPKKVENYVRRLGFNDIRVRYTERQMFCSPVKSEANWATPIDMARLFVWFDNHHNDTEQLRFLWELMTECKSGGNRIPSCLPVEAKIIHKTGTGFPTPTGPSGVCDAGVVVMPDGSHLAVSVFVKHPGSEGQIAELVSTYLP